ncbi:DUF4179 domain-containing protein [Brevibacillus fluminis]|uniref:DUF4179 domain-containing protein n=1 Tax=Brevibacillus fluminis TaxID=511487 RepID=A0A3M8DH95_9BACL|nr:DUF4179 domain-containing protein [Brevibacillus fluminis]RNB86969.1 DUF4179 domain-containing protein [Brevibacillus fluminis]
MRDIYRLLKEVEVDEVEMREIEEATKVTMLEKAKVKKRLLESVRKKKGWAGTKVIAAAFAGLLVGGTAYLGINDPAYAAGIPVIGDIFRFLDSGRTGVYDLYQTNANEVNVSKESNGIQITVKNAVFDGKTISYTYEVKSPQDLGESPLIGVGPSLLIHNYNGGLTGSNHVEKVAPNTYVGQANYSIAGEMEQVECQLSINNILKIENNQQEEIDGKWSFSFKLQTVESDAKLVHKRTEKDGFVVTIDKIKRTPMSFVTDYTQQVPDEYRDRLQDVSAHLIVKDDLGNVYEGEDNGGHGDSSTGIMKWSMTFRKLEEKASKLTITPIIYISENKGGVSFDENGKEKKETPVGTKENKKVTMPEITIEIK